MNKGIVNWNEVNKDPRLRNMDDNRPYWAISAEDYYGRTYESIAYDDTRGDYNSKAFSGDLMYKAAKTPFDMRYIAPIREKMTNYTVPARETITTQKQYTVPARETITTQKQYTVPARETMMPQFDKLYPHNVYGGQEFKGIKSETDFTSPVIKENLQAKMWFNAFGDYNLMPRDAEPVNPYIPLSQESYRVSSTMKNKIEEPIKKIPQVSDDYVPKNNYTPLLGRQKLITLKPKFPDQSRDKRYPDTTNQTFANIDRQISIKSDRMIDIEEDYSLPLWNVRDAV
jgi:hypothetical protein